MASVDATRDVIPGWSKGPDPESRDSGFIAARCPGMTTGRRQALDTLFIALRDLPVVPMCRSSVKLCLTPNRIYIPSIPSRRGAFRDRHGRWNGMRWTQRRG
jgi:hypothetical protein